MRLNYVVLLIFCGCLVSGYEVVNVLEDAFTPLLIAAARALVAAISIFAFCLIARQPLRPAFRRSGKLALIGVLGFGILWGMVSLGERQVDPELAMLLVCVVPIVTLILSALPPDPKYVWWPAWIGTAIASLGLVVVIGPGRIADQPSAIYAVLMIGFGFASYALANVLAEHFTRGLSPAAAGGVAMLYAAILLWGMVFLFEPLTDLNPTVDACLNLLVLGVVGSALPVMLMYFLVQRAGAGFVSLYGYILPLLGIFVGWIAFGRVPGSSFLVGVPITLAGVAILQWARQRGMPAQKNESL